MMFSKAKDKPEPDGGLVRATQELGAAMDKYRQAAGVERVASAALAAALEELNACQARVDEAVAEMKKSAPPNSSWTAQAYRLPPALPEVRK